MNIPTPIADFFRMKNDHNDAALRAIFDEDATVIDGGEGKEMHGAEAIEKWIQKSISGLNLKTEIRNCTEQNGEYIVDTVMTGDFKASPARFEYFIKLDEGKIASLRVEFRGSLNKDA